MERKRCSGGACTRRNGDSFKARKTIRLPDGSYLEGEPFLLTICTPNKQQLLSRQRYGRQAFEVMFPAAEKTAATLWCGVVMPDHVHMPVTAQQGKSPLDMAACFKRMATLAVRQVGYNDALWQRRIQDRGLRTNFNNNISTAIRYVLDNPVRNGLALSSNDRPFSFVHQDIVVDG